MSQTNLVRLILTGLVLLWAISELWPPYATPWQDYMLDNVTASLDAEGNAVESQEANREALRALMERADALVEEHRGQTDNAYRTPFVALRSIAAQESIDLSSYFADIRLSDIPNLRKRNQVLLDHLLRESKGALRYGLDLAGGVAITFEIDRDQLPADSFLADRQLEDARRVMLDRVDGLGVAEPVVRLKGNDRIEVQMPGISTQDNPDIAEVIGAPAKLEFSIVHRTARPGRDAAPLGFVPMVEENTDPRTGEITESPVYIQRRPVMQGDAIAEAFPQLTPSGGWEVGFSFTDAGRQQFARVTEQIADGNTAQSIGRLAIILDGRLVSAPTVRERIYSDQARITGNFDQREAIELANALNNPLAVQLDVAELYEVGPTLARDAQDASFQAGAWGAALVILFMLIYYGVAGGIAATTVGINLILVLGGLSSMGATLTLPGVAALVLTIGMAVDANILIFERIREELKAGKSAANAVRAGFDKAFSTIVDANVTTMITALILVWLGTGPVKGFGVTLAAGILATVFCALIVSRWMMELAVRLGLLNQPFRFQLLSASEIPFLNYAKNAFRASWAVVAIGVLAFVLHFDEAFGIDFTGGDEVSVAFENRLSVEQVSEVAAEAGLGEVSIFFQTPLGAADPLMVVQTAPGEGAAVFDALAAAYSSAGLEKVGQTQIGASVGAEVTRSAILAVLVALFAILLYIAVRFEIGFGLGALTATVHDVLMTIGLFVALGEFLGLGSGQFSAPMIAAILMTVGYSINDTIVVFDRIREELTLNPGMNLRRIVHLSINRVLSRTVLTSITTLFVSLTLFLFGAGVITDFALVFLIGILTGTFSSVFIASPIFYWYHKGDREHAERKEILPSYDWTVSTPATKTKPVEG